MGTSETEQKGRIDPELFKPAEASDPVPKLIDEQDVPEMGVMRTVLLQHNDLSCDPMGDCDTELEIFFHKGSTGDYKIDRCGGCGKTKIPVSLIHLEVILGKIDRAGQNLT